MDNLKDISEDTIERFVLGQLPDPELDAFFAYQLLHPEIKVEIDRVRTRLLTLRGALTPPPRGKSQRWVWAVIVLIVLGFMMLTYFLTPSPPQKPPLPKSQSEEKPPIPRQTEIAQPRQSSIIPAKQKKSKAPMAAYRPNKVLELQINGSLRSNGVQFQITEPTQNQVFRKQSGQVEFRLLGSLRSSIQDTNSNYQVLIFDNQPTHLESGRFVAALQIPMDTNEIGDVEFKLIQRLKLPFGLYYFIIEEKSNSNWHFVGKFRVE